MIFVREKLLLFAPISGALVSALSDHRLIGRVAFQGVTASRTAYGYKFPYLYFMFTFASMRALWTSDSSSSSLLPSKFSLFFVLRSLPREAADERIIIEPERAGNFIESAVSYGFLVAE